jgi:hypothetical protein
MTTLEHEHFPAGARQVRGVHQAVVTAADDDCVVVTHAKGSVKAEG